MKLPRFSKKMLPGKAPTAKLGRAALAGMAGGVAGAWAMSAFSAGWEKLMPASAGRPQGRTINVAEARQRRPAPMHASQQEWDSTMNTATAVARKVLQRRLPQTQKERGAVAVHYAIGGVMGAGYAVVREYVPAVGAGAGAVFGAAMFVLAQEIGTPLMGLSKPVRDYSPAMQANSMGEHVAWGLTTETVRRALRRKR
jgi:uncharacterized membrane protein YagU involved in acid resistance